MEELFKKLDEIINSYDKFIIMAHANPDLDALGSSLALYYRILDLNKDVSIFLDVEQIESLDDSIVKSIEKLSDVKFVNERNYHIDEKTLLFIVDVHSAHRLFYPDIINEDVKKVVLDHHIKKKDYIRNTVYKYIDSTLSSMVEMMTYYLKYSNISIGSTVSSIMLAGLEIDTNAYNLKTTSKTYQAASLLMDFGADVILKQELLKETKDEYIKRADYIKQSYRLTDKIAMCVLTEEVEQQVLAEIADDLLKFVDIEASFVIGPVKGNKTGVSTRSMGNIDVEKIVSQIGGGGSKTNAAAQVDMPLPEVRKKIIKALR